MSKKNPIEKSEYIREEYKEYIWSSFELSNSDLRSVFETQLEKEQLFKGPYVALDLPFQRGKNINQLVEDGSLCKSFKNLGNLNLERPLYAHQEEAIHHICSGKSAVVTTGTGSGKTECFLYPILNEILRDIENGKNDAGIRALFLYPMNALVNDQIERIRKMLTPCKDITFGFFTGDTEEKVSSNYREKYGEENDTVIPENELVSREEIRKNPPHLLFTNYSMLEYLMIRPNDYSIFTPEKLSNWKFVVLDEAHTYNGSLGIEISLLLRRVTALAERKPRFILTSATLGKKGESEKNIVRFAKNLTSVDFSESDIIFSKRIPFNTANLSYTVLPEEYVKAYESDSVESLLNVTRKYNTYTGNNRREIIFEFLCRDYNVYHIYKELQSGSRSFSDLCQSFDGRISEKQLMSLIELINQAEKNGIGLFDLKYHSFVRPLNGAYITLGSKPELSLTKTNLLHGLKAFELGNCKYCNTPYLIGKVQKNSKDGLDYLYQNNEIDIYENYGSNEFIKLDFFLLDNKTEENEEDNEDNNDINDSLEECVLCTKCGAIHSADNLNARECDCDPGYKRTVYKVIRNEKRDGGVSWNNINKCPCCGHQSHAGIIKTLNLGKDEGTALIAQILYESLGDDSTSSQTTKKLSLKLNRAHLQKSQEKVKQFLSFSDSRQQASFSAVFLNANHTRLLRKRLIWKIIEDHNYKTLTVDELASHLTALIKEKELFDNDMTPAKNAWAAILVDLLKIDGSYDGEGMGLYYFDIDLDDIFDQLDEEDISDSLQELNITDISKKDLYTIMQMVLEEFKSAPAVNYTKSTLTPDERKEVLEYRCYDNYIMLNTSRKMKGIKSLLPVKNKDNKVVRYVEKVCNCDDENAKKLIEILFNNLAVEGDLFKEHESKSAYQIDASRYRIKNYKQTHFYQCRKCKKLTPYNVHDRCPQDNCDGTLVEVNPDQALASNYYRKQYKSKAIERIVIKEHTAQLDRKKAKKYQQEFKAKKINILSCSTTFEMGIDIGDLETVFMRNVPPTPANYVQRAGRAGRRKDSAAYILTYCGAGSHDYTYFCEPEKMISGVINPPYFNVYNKKIIMRHLMAASLGFFFRKYPNYFKSIDELVFNGGIEEFNSYMDSHPIDLKEYIDTKVLPSNNYESYHNYRWYDSIGGKDEKLEHFYNDITSIAKEYSGAKEEALKDENYTEAEYYKDHISRLHKEKVIDQLSKYCVIPKYGFPIDVVELDVYQEGKLNNSLDLSRDLKIAISEYAPDSEVIVDGKKYTSKYINLPKTGEFQRHYFCTCPNCKKINVGLTVYSFDKCKYCGEPMQEKNTDYYIEPIYGFKTGITKESTRMKPKRSYSGEVSYVGGGKKDEEILDIDGKIIVETTTNDELLVVNKSSFYMCPKCGYSDIAKGNVITEKKIIPHNNYRQYNCECDELNLIKIGHSFQTDIARLTIPSLEIQCENGFSKALSFMYAFLEGMSIALNIERTDIDGVMEMNMETGSYDLLIYDNVPGGAGHVKRLIDRESLISVIENARQKVSKSCCDENTSCYNCLRNYYNQSYHNRLVRKYARDFAEQLLRDIQ